MLHARMLRYIDEVARAGSIRKAAAQLNVASSAINRQIIALEEELGFPIFERMPRRLRLTVAGELLVAHVRETLKNYAGVSARLNALKGLRRGKVKVATTLGLAAGPMRSIVSDFVDRHPGIQIVLRGLVADAIPNAVIAGDVDLALSFDLLPNPALRSVVAVQSPIGAVVAADHPLASHEAVHLADLIVFPLVLAEPGMSLRDALDLAFAEASIEIEPVIETNSIETLKQLVLVSERVTVLNRLDAAEECDRGQLRFLPLAERQVKSQTIKLISRARTVLDPASSLFAEEVSAALHQRFAHG